MSRLIIPAIAGLLLILCGSAEAFVGPNVYIDRLKLARAGFAPVLSNDELLQLLSELRVWASRGECRAYLGTADHALVLSHAIGTAVSIHSGKEPLALAAGISAGTRGYLPPEKLETALFYLREWALSQEDPRSRHVAAAAIADYIQAGQTFSGPRDPTGHTLSIQRSTAWSAQGVSATELQMLGIRLLGYLDHIFETGERLETDWRETLPRVLFAVGVFAQIHTVGVTSVKGPYEFSNLSREAKKYFIAIDKGLKSGKFFRRVEWNTPVHLESVRSAVDMARNLHVPCRRVLLATRG